MKITNRELRELARLYEAQGWKVTMRNNGHLKWEAPNGFVYFSSQTPSDHRAILNIKKDLARWNN